MTFPFPTAGVDEAGRGPLAGPVVAAAVILNPDDPIGGLKDSKKLTARRRALLEEQIMARALYVGVGMASVEEIDVINILQATFLAMTRAVEGLGTEPAHILVDGNRLPKWRYDARAIVGGDGLHDCISAASIIAKETRDRIMIKAAQDYPAYGWEKNKGYGSATHMAAMKEHGITPLHRRSFAPVAQLALI